MDFHLQNLEWAMEKALKMPPKDFQTPSKDFNEFLRVNLPSFTECLFRRDIKSKVGLFPYVCIDGCTCVGRMGIRMNVCKDIDKMGVGL